MAQYEGYEVEEECMLAESAGRNFNDYMKYIKSQLHELLIFQRKEDGIRARIMDGRLIDRKGKDITYKFPEFKHIEKLKGVYLDGEIVAQTHEFDDISGRIHVTDEFKRKLLAKKQPAKFIAFDIPIKEIDLISRLTMLEEKIDEINTLVMWIECAEYYEGDENMFDDLWSVVRAKKWEGIMIKSIFSYYLGGRYTSWRKAKNFIEAIAEFDMYETHPKGITLEQSGTGNRIVVNGMDAKTVLNEIDVHGSVLCHIQYMELASGKWRTPSFRGVVL